MGCFSLFPCFTSSKRPKLNKYVNPIPPSYGDQGYEKNRETVLITLEEESTNIGSSQTPIWKSRDNSEDQVISDSDGKTVAIDLDVETNTDILIEDVEILSAESKEDKEKNMGIGKLGVLVQLENAKERDDEKKKENGKLGVLVQIENEKIKEKQNNVGVHVEIENEMERKKESEEDEDFGVQKKMVVKTEEHKTEVQNPAFSDSSVSSYISYPPMHRYHNCVINEEDEDQVFIQEDSSESLFSLSIDQRRQSKSCPVEVDDKEVNSPLKISSTPELIAKSIMSFPNWNDHNQTIDSLLNPIENLNQWKTLKTIPPIPIVDLHQEKENLYLEQENISKLSDRKGKLKNDTVITTSLSSWLVEPEKSTTVSKEESQYSTGNSYSYSDGATSWKSLEDRPILGAWTIDEVKQISARSSPKKSPCHHPDETPIIGTVGSYWSHIGQAADSSNSCTSPLGIYAKSRRNGQKKALSCHSSPSKRRLERAFDKSVI